MDNNYRQPQVNQNDSTGEFSFSFSKSLLNKLKELADKNTLFINGIEEAKKQELSRYGSYTTTIARCLIQHLACQIKYPEPIESTIRPAQVENLVKTAEEFLAIFEK